jgi:hypothetical protein
VESENKIKNSNDDSESRQDTSQNIKILKHSEYNVIKSTFEKALNEKDKSFSKVFSQTQLFMSYFEEVRLRK